MRIELSARSLTAIFIVVAAGCSKPVPPPPVDAGVRPSLPGPATSHPAEPLAPFKNDTTIPRELGDFTFDMNAGDWDWVGASWPKRNGSLSFADVWTVLARPAKSSDDVLRKAGYVRFAIPRQGISPDECEGGTAGLLLSIFRSDQHYAVRLAALAALRGVHLSVLNDMFWPDVCGAADPCPSPVLADHAPEYVVLARFLMSDPRSGRMRKDLFWLIRYLMINETDLPEGFETLKLEFADALVDQRIRLSMLSGWRAGDRNSVLVGAALRPMLMRNPELLPAAIEFLGRRSDHSKEVMDELRAVLAGLDAAPDDKLHRQIRKALNRVLKL